MAVYDYWLLHHSSYQPIPVSARQKNGFSRKRSYTEKMGGNVIKRAVLLRLMQFIPLKTPDNTRQAG